MFANIELKIQKWNSKSHNTTMIKNPLYLVYVVDRSSRMFHFSYFINDIKLNMINDLDLYKISKSGKLILVGSIDSHIVINSILKIRSDDQKLIDLRDNIKKARLKYELDIKE